jgi:chorismate mutase
MRHPVEKHSKLSNDALLRHSIRRTMQILKGALAILITLAIGGIGPAFAQDAMNKLQPLVETSARRLFLAKQVALAKWDSQAPVEDTAREAEVVTAAIKDGESRGLDRTSVSHFFSAQIEANKLVQYVLLADWRRAGTVPAHSPIDLAMTIRPELDRLQKELVRELADTVVVRASATCPSDTAKAVGKYLAGDKHDAGSLREVALDRAMAATCP